MKNTKTELPVVPEQPDPRSVAQMTLEAAFSRDAVTVEQKAAVLAETVWAYGCDRNARHFGLFFAGDPRERLEFGGGDWYSVYHDNREPFYGEMDDLVCQQCYAETGERVHLRLARAVAAGRKEGLRFRITPSWMQRFAHATPRVEIEKWLAIKVNQSQPPKDKPADAARTEHVAAT